MGASAGQIDLDLNVNRKQFDKQLSGIASVAKKAGAMLAAAFAVKKIADFSKQCLELGSDLAEVQNVVDVTFPAMSAQVEKFAKSTTMSFGLSETMAKKFTGTFGAMARAFGFTEKQAFEMSTTLTGLAGDVASFYNTSQDEAYTKLKSVFTGETETLKDLGVVMTQNALDAYALANGYGKATKSMSEAEKVALRYKFVQDQLAFSVGDFARTSDSWANQTRILSLQFDSLKASIGQGLINLFTPIVKVINTVISKLITLANAFKAFTELITGKKSDSSGIADTANGLNDASGAAEDLADSTSGVGSAAKKAAKEMKALMGFDEINKLSEKDSSGGSSGSGGGGGGSTDIDLGGLAKGDTVIDKTSSSMSKLITRGKELASLFKKGFVIGFGDSEKNIGTIKTSIGSIRTTLKGIFTSKEVTSAAATWAASVVTNMGKITGSVASIGISIVTNLTAGISKSLDEKKEYIKTKVSNLFRLSAETWQVNGSFFAAIGDIISSALTSESAVNITSDICSVLTTGFLGGAELFAKAGLDITKYLVQPIVANKGKIKEAISNTLKPISTVVGTIKKVVEDAFTVFSNVYDKHVAPLFKVLRNGASDSFGKFLDAYNKYVAPVLSYLATKFDEVYTAHLKPVLGKIGKLFGTIADSVKDVYLTWIKPFVDWCIQNIIPFLAPIFATLGATILNVFGKIGDIVGGIIDVFSGVITFLTGVFTGNWGKVWDGIKTIFWGFVEIIKGFANGLKSLFSGLNKAIKQIFNSIVDWFKDKFQKAFSAITTIFTGLSIWFAKQYLAIQSVFIKVGDWFKQKFKTAYTNIVNVFAGIGAWFSGKYNAITNVFTDIGEWFERKFKTAYTNVTNAFKEIGSWFGNKYTAIQDVFSGIGDWFKGKFETAYTKVTGAFSEVGNFFGGIWDTIKSKFTTIGANIGDAIGGAFKSVVNGVLSMIESTINKGIGFINGAIDAINKVNPFKDIGHLQPLSIPRLAQGGYVKANTPQLAMIGDNRHQGEVVAPEDKLREMAMQAVQMAGGGNSSNAEVISLLKRLISLVQDGGDIVMIVDSQELARAAQKGNMKLSRKYTTAKLVFE